MRTNISASLAVFPLALALSGCTTMDMLGDAGDSFENGDIGTGMFMGVTGLLFGPLLDVFTLGGTLEGEEITQTWGAGLDSYAAIKGGGATTASNTAIASAAPVAVASSSAPSSSSSYYVAAAGQEASGSQYSGGFSQPVASRPSQATTPAASAAPAPRVAVSLVRERYITTVPNQYEVVLKNMGNVRVSCRITFQYQYPDGRGGLAWDSIVKPVGPIAVGGTGVAVAGGTSKNIGNVSWKQTCEQWAHDK